MKLCTVIHSLRGWSLCYSVVKSQKAVSAYLTSKLILPFGFARQHTSERGRPARVFINTRRKGVVSAYNGGF